MSTLVNKLYEDAMRLSDDERAALATWLMDSLDQGMDEDAQAAWDREIHRRVAELEQVQPKPFRGPLYGGPFWAFLMSRPALEFHVEAAEEVRAAVDWYEQRTPGAARAFALELDHAIEQIRDAPTRWPSHLHGTRYCPMRQFPYLVVYRELDNGLEIVAVAHGRRRPGYWKNRSAR